MTAAWRHATWSYPVDPKCPVVRQLLDAGQMPNAEWHRAGCRRCRTYGVANAVLTRSVKPPG